MDTYGEPCILEVGHAGGHRGASTERSGLLVDLFLGGGCSVSLALAMVVTLLLAASCGGKAVPER